VSALSRERRRRLKVAREGLPRKVPLDYRRFKAAPEIDPREQDEIVGEVRDALRRGDEEPDQNLKVG
jgi:hypothetical protein